ncbi:hypothetical protein ACRE_069750 [Hapsidospora chrysogenum ATCC 11550]|uniref:Uncharacterized protein n=1 Tax=Hapsidospora chrysogenum (strain ATCC 11550 / CBS 779.69 / DSM 880 / IAM 14645 / JCM 23072 / IMI 49137) TaxID=857340 RepID=A0A086SYX2_HAPC1|nr:hypothetical protein ACRE_069750 [Hapsidospora chrysogenum ATCC 11550]
MSADGSHNSSGGGNGNGNGDTNPRRRRGSITQAALSNLFQRGPPSSATGPPFSGQPIPPVADPQRRRLSVTTLGLSGTSPSGATALGIRRGSMSTNSNNSDSIDENVIEDEDGARTAPTTPFTRRMSFGTSAMRGYRPGGSPGNGNNDPISPPPPPAQLGRRHSQHRGPIAQTQGTSVTAALAGRRASVGMTSPPLPQASKIKNPRTPSDNASRPDQQGFNWPEQLRSRAESNVAGGARPSFHLASSPPRPAAPHHDRAKSVSDMPQPPREVPTAKPVQERPKPDPFQERILKGDFYMD